MYRLKICASAELYSVSVGVYRVSIHPAQDIVKTSKVTGHPAIRRGRRAADAEARTVTPDHPNHAISIPDYWHKSSQSVTSPLVGALPVQKHVTLGCSSLIPQSRQKNSLKVTNPTPCGHQVAQSLEIEIGAPSQGLA